MRPQEDLLAQRLSRLTRFGASGVSRSLKARIVCSIALMVLALVALSFTATFASAAGPVTSGCNAGSCATVSGGSLPAVSPDPSTDSRVVAITSPSRIQPSTTYDFMDAADLSSPTAFRGGTLSGSSQVRVVGSDWNTWNPQQNGLHVLFVTSGTETITFNVPQTGVLARAEPDNFGVYNVEIQAFDTSGKLLGSFTKAINGDAGASNLGLLSSTNNIGSVQLSADPAASGFAFSNLTYSTDGP